MLFIITDILFAITITLMISLILKINIKIGFKKKTFIKKIEREFDRYNYFHTNRKLIIEGYLDKLFKKHNINFDINLFYIISLLASLIGVFIGFKLDSPFFTIILFLLFLSIPSIIIVFIATRRNIQSYRTTFNVLYASEKISQTTNNPNVVFKYILKYLSSKDKKCFEEFLNKFNTNSDYEATYNELYNKLNNDWLKELVIYARDTSKGIDLNRAIRSMLNHYKIMYKQYNEQKKKVDIKAWGLLFFTKLSVMCNFILYKNYLNTIKTNNIVYTLYKTNILITVIAFIIAIYLILKQNKY